MNSHQEPIEEFGFVCPVASITVRVSNGLPHERLEALVAALGEANIPHAGAIGIHLPGASGCVEIEVKLLQDTQEAHKMVESVVNRFNQS